MGETRAEPAVSPLTGAVIGAAVAGIITLTGRVTLAVAVALAVVLLTHARLLSPDIDRRIVRSMSAIGRGVGTAVSAVALTVVALFLFFPVWAALRLLRLDPLRSPGSDTNWRPRRGGVSHRRPFAADHFVLRTPGAGLNWRPAVVGACVGASAALITVAAWPETAQLLRPEAAPRHDPLGTAAIEADPFAAEVAGEVGAVFNSLTYDAAVGFSYPNFNGRHVDIVARERVGYAPAGPEPPDLEVWFFGGSTMFGVHQRGDRTIPSSFVRAAERDGLRIRARNYGAMAYVNHQETALFEELLRRRPAPDLAVFYDGFNELLVNVAGSLVGLATPGEPTHAFADAFGDVISEERGQDPRLPPPIAPSDTATPVTLDRALAAALELYRQDLEHARQVGASYGVDVMHTWQPDIYSKQLLPGERAMLEPLGFDEFQFAGWVEVVAAVPGRLPEGVVDLRGALDAADRPVLADFVHTNEEGARLVGEALYEAATELIA